MFSDRQWGQLDKSTAVFFQLSIIDLSYNKLGDIVLFCSQKLLLSVYDKYRFDCNNRYLWNIFCLLGTHKSL